MEHEYWWDSTSLCKSFDVDGAASYLIQYDTVIKRPATWRGGPGTGWKHSEETKKKMSESAKGRDMSLAIAVS